MPDMQAFTNLWNIGNSFNYLVSTILRLPHRRNRHLSDLPHPATLRRLRRRERGALRRGQSEAGLGILERDRGIRVPVRLDGAVAIALAFAAGAPSAHVGFRGRLERGDDLAGAHVCYGSVWEGIWLAMCTKY